MLFEKAEVIRSSQSGKTVKTLITQNRLVVDGKRWPVFEIILKQKVDGGTIIFTNTRDQCDALAEEMTEKGYANVVYRGEMDKTERRGNLRAFRKGEIGFLISTDLAARGLDVEHVGRVVNYHLPQLMENYLHRAGRTARAGRMGVVVNLVTERDERLISRVEGKKVEVPRTIREKMTPEQQSMKQTQQNEERAQQAHERAERGEVPKTTKGDGTGRKVPRAKAQLFSKNQEKVFKFAKKITKKPSAKRSPARSPKRRK